MAVINSLSSTCLHFEDNRPANEYLEFYPAITGLQNDAMLRHGKYTLRSSNSTLEPEIELHQQTNCRPKICGVLCKCCSMIRTGK